MRGGSTPCDDPFRRRLNRAVAKEHLTKQHRCRKTATAFGHQVISAAETVQSRPYVVLCSRLACWDSCVCQHACDQSAPRQALILAGMRTVDAVLP